MQWDDGPHAGFAPPSAPELWLPLAPDAAHVNVKCQLADPGSLLNLYRRLLAYRRTRPALQSGSYQAVPGMARDCYVFWRQSHDQRLLIALNFSAQEQELALPEDAGYLVLSTYLDREERAGRALRLRASEGVLLEFRG
jgi:alpha-glucosidase